MRNRLVVAAGASRRGSVETRFSLATAFVVAGLGALLAVGCGDSSTPTSPTSTSPVNGGFGVNSASSVNSASGASTSAMSVAGAVNSFAGARSAKSAKSIKGPKSVKSAKALFMTVWRPRTRSAEHSCGIRQG